ncbi:hypothetical protein E2C01_002328 [Portunus trituberculatus]|uniref:Uncharacterized protein n=1 Tax=Portunus trituberculatus TaxID=210409 RepID=A0A5B7CJM7_PORTR|nr:hypothetical protein [Portunus trituberculatus]
MPSIVSLRPREARLTARTQRESTRLAIELHFTRHKNTPRPSKRNPMSDNILYSCVTANCTRSADASRDASLAAAEEYKDCVTRPEHRRVMK